MLKRAQNLQLKLRKRLNQRAARSAAPAMAEEREEESWAPMEALREKRKALRQRRVRTRDVATLAQIERELFEVEEQLVSKKIAERLPVSLAAKSATLAAFGLAARSGRRGGGLLWPADGPPRGLRRHRGLRAPQRRAGGGLRLRVAANPVDGRAGVLPRPPAARPERHGRRPEHQRPLHSLIHNFQALAGRQGLTLGATPANTGGCAEYKCPHPTLYRV